MELSVTAGAGLPTGATRINGPGVQPYLQFPWSHELGNGWGRAANPLLDLHAGHTLDHVMHALQMLHVAGAEDSYSSQQAGLQCLHIAFRVWNPLRLYEPTHGTEHHLWLACNDGININS